MRNLCTTSDGNAHERSFPGFFYGGYIFPALSPADATGKDAGIPLKQVNSRGDMLGIPQFYFRGSKESRLVRRDRIVPLKLFTVRRHSIREVDNRWLLPCRAFGGHDVIDSLVQEESRRRFQMIWNMC